MANGKLARVSLDHAFDLLYPRKNEGSTPKGIRRLTKLRIMLVAAAIGGELVDMKKEISPDLYPEISNASDQEQRARGLRRLLKRYTMRPRPFRIELRNEGSTRNRCMKA